jgi:hypothetical protein
MTRARDALWLHVPLRYQHHRQNPRSHDRHGYAQRSRFLSERVVATCEATTAAAPTPFAHGVAVAGDDGATVELDSFLTSLLD